MRKFYCPAEGKIVAWVIRGRLRCRNIECAPVMLTTTRTCPSCGKRGILQYGDVGWRLVSFFGERWQEEHGTGRRDDDGISITPKPTDFRNCLIRIWCAKAAGGDESFTGSTYRDVWINVFNLKCYLRCDVHPNKLLAHQRNHEAAREEAKTRGEPANGWLLNFVIGRRRFYIGFFGYIPAEDPEHCFLGV